MSTQVNITNHYSHLFPTTPRGFKWNLTFWRDSKSVGLFLRKGSDLVGSHFYRDGVDSAKLLASLSEVSANLLREVLSVPEAPKGFDTHVSRGKCEVARDYRKLGKFPLGSQEDNTKALARIVQAYHDELSNILP